MGFFSSIGKFISDKVEKVTNWAKEKVSKAVEWVERVLGISEAPSYNPDNASVDETMKVNELLEKCIKDYGEEANKYDKMAKNIVGEYITMIKKQLKQVNEKEEIIKSHIFDMFDYQSKEIKKSLNKIYSKQIEQGFSLNNNKVLEILKLPAGETKKDRIRKFAQETLEKANEKLMKGLEEFLKEQQDFITTELKKYTDNIEKEYSVAINETQEIERTIKEGEEKIQLKKSKYEYILFKIKKLKIA